MPRGVTVRELLILELATILIGFWAWWMLSRAFPTPSPARVATGTVYLLTPAGRGPVISKFKNKVEVSDGWTVWHTPAGETCRTRATVLAIEEK